MEDKILEEIRNGVVGKGMLEVSITTEAMWYYKIVGVDVNPYTANLIRIFGRTRDGKEDMSVITKEQALKLSREKSIVVDYTNGHGMDIRFLYALKEIRE